MLKMLAGDFASRYRHFSRKRSSYGLRQDIDFEQGRTVWKRHEAFVDIK
jgi:hypothetical protein